MRLISFTKSYSDDVFYVNPHEISMVLPAHSEDETLLLISAYSKEPITVNGSMGEVLGLIEGAGR